MEKKLYLLVVLGFLTCLLPARAQDSSSCNARFYTSVSQNAVFLQAVDSFSNIGHYWNFGDGRDTGFSNRLSGISHTYTFSGVYQITHIARSLSGNSCYDSSVQTVSVSLPPACSVYFDISRDTVNHHIYSFTSHATDSFPGADTVRWYSNDSLIGSGPVLSGLYFNNGSYTICARLSTGSGCHSEQCGQITVGNPDSCGQAASFVYIADSSNRRLIRFIPTPNNDSAGYYWNFGDSSSSTARLPAHLYTSPGFYNVSLTVTGHSGNDSCRSGFSQTIPVDSIPAPPPPPDTCTVRFTYTANPARTNQITFRIQDSVKFDTVTWTVTAITDSLPAGTLHGNNAVYLFSDTGCFLIRLDAFRSGCRATAYQMICIDSIPAGTGGFISSYPNPAFGHVSIDLRLKEDDLIRIIVFNSMGNQVLTRTVAGYRGIDHITIPLTGLPPGIYYMQIQYGKEVRRSKFRKA